MASLAEFLAAHQAQTHEDGRWPDLRFQLASYLCRRLPPLELIGSARAVLLRAGQGMQVMVVRDPGSVHILPGGRRQAGESLTQTLRRELLEETGWAIHQPYLLGVRHFHHCRTAAGHPTPDFFQAVFAAHARAATPGPARSAATSSMRRSGRSPTCDACPYQPTSGCSSTPPCGGANRPAAEAEAAAEPGSRTSTHRRPSRQGELRPHRRDRWR
jgi:ADP-ribose pyrophosphatase YjhB (NUDIX family)